MSDEIVGLDVSDFIATVTLQRPPVNAMNRAAREDIMIEQFHGQVARLLRGQA